MKYERYLNLWVNKNTGGLPFDQYSVQLILTDCGIDYHAVYFGESEVRNSTSMLI